jgi:hypothetical protein
VAVQLAWRHTNRRDVEIGLYVSMRMMHLRGWQHIAVCCTVRGHVYVALELADTTPEDDAQAWATLFDRRYRIETTIAELLADVGRFSAVYIDGGVGEFLNAYEEETHRLELLRQQARQRR